MYILQRRVLKDLLQVFGGVATALTMMLVVVGVIGEATKSGLGPTEILKILPYVVPSLLPFTIPATFLLTVCVVYGRMSGDQEITAMKAAGINVIEILWPAFILGATLSLGTLLLTDLFVPWSRAKIEYVITTALEDIFLDKLRNHNQFEDTAKGISVSCDRVDDRRLINPTFRYTLPGGQSAHITAREATIQFDLKNQEILLDLKDGFMVTPGGVSMKIREHEKRSFPLPTQSTGPMPPRNISMQDIRAELAQIDVDYARTQERRVIDTTLFLSTGRFEELIPARQSPVDRTLTTHEERRQKLVTEIHSRIALACSCFFFALVGSPFAIQQGKRQFLTSFAICFAPILLLYYPTVLLTMNLAREGNLNPVWGMWIGNVGLALAAASVLRRVLRH
jgi:lipopolysaccharide export system permease protein